MNAICAGFQDAPKICQPLLNDNDLEDDLDTGIYVEYQDGYSVWHIFAICLFAVFVLVIILCMYRRHAKRQMKETMDQQIATAVNHYVALSSQDTEANDKSKAKTNAVVDSD